MSKLTKKQFGELCSIKTGDLSIYIRRGKVIVDEHGYIDDRNEVNRLFIGKRNSIKENPIEKVAPPKNSNTESTGIEPEGMSLLELEKEKKIADLKKLEVETRISLLKEEKLMGANVPVELVKTIIANMSKSFIVEFKNGVDDIVRLLVKKKDYNATELSEVRGGLSNIINEAMKKSISSSKKELNTIAENYIETRGGGENE